MVCFAQAMAKPLPQSSVHLDAVRALAALTVFAGHARDLFIGSPRAAAGLGHAAATGAAPQLTIGHLAVIVFFVLSGYLVGGGVLRAIKDGEWSWGGYAMQRMTRLWVALIPALLLGVVLDSFGSLWFGPLSIYGGPAGQGEVAANLSSHLSMAALFGNMVFVQGILVPTLGTNDSLWSLTNEFWYYALFPVALFALFGREGNARRAIYALAFVAILFFVGWKIALYLGIWLMGAALELLPRKLHKQAISLLIPAGILLFLDVCAMMLKMNLGLVQSDFIVAATFCVLCYVMLNSKEEAKDSLYARASHFVAKMSYTLYLTHLPLLVFACALMMPVWHRWPLDALHIVGMVPILALVFGASYLLYLFFERNTGAVRNTIAQAFRSRTELA
jgi:peptidoglycan/LPS O-acetylase OafA/YrhL